VEPKLFFRFCAGKFSSAAPIPGFIHANGNGTHFMSQYLVSLASLPESARAFGGCSLWALAGCSLHATSILYGLGGASCISVGSALHALSLKTFLLWIYPLVGCTFAMGFGWRPHTPSFCRGRMFWISVVFVTWQFLPSIFWTYLWGSPIPTGDTLGWRLPHRVRPKTLHPPFVYGGHLGCVFRRIPAGIRLNLPKRDQQEWNAGEFELPD
jgi:hypothetical protein